MSQLYGAVGSEVGDRLQPIRDDDISTPNPSRVHQGYTQKKGLRNPQNLTLHLNVNSQKCVITINYFLRFYLV